MFRAWASFWQRAPPPTTSSATSTSRTDISPRQVWKAYYDLLSVILQHGLLYTPVGSQRTDLLVVPWSGIADERYVDAKVKQRAELKRIEATYESLLLNETQFPKASQTNAEVEEWVEQAVGNWRILCGTDWTDSELGEGGKEAIGRGMLDVLYRAATKTFHSTAILRQLFTVHAAIGEFDLAMHAINSYADIASKGKARAQKTGTHELGFDTEDTAVLTIAEAMRVLCKYGDREQGEKALELSKTLESWLGQQRPTTPDELETSEDTRTGQPEPPSHPTHMELQLKTLAVANTAIGIAQAHWARSTYETDARSALQEAALSHLRRAQSYDKGSVETAFAFARLLAETQEVSAAIEVIKSAIAYTNTQDDVDDDDEAEDQEKQRQLIPMWHLLSLCLTAKDEYDPAIKMCEAAFEQFGDPAVLFGQAGSRSDSEKPSRASYGLVDQMDNFDMEAMLEVKMSQLTFVELTEGAETAVEFGDELLALYARLFGNPEHLKTPSKRPPSAAPTVPPSRAGGTLRSIAGSIRPKTGRTSVEKDTFRQASVASTAPPRTSAGSDGRSATTNGQAGGSPIAITITNEDGVPAEKAQRQHHHHHLHVPFKLRGHHGDFRDAGGSLRSKKSAEDLQEKPALDGADGPPVPPKDSDVTDHAHSAANPPVVQSAVSHSMSPEAPTGPRQPLKEMEHNGPQDAWPAPAGHEDQPPEQDIRLPAPHPASNAMPSAHFGSLQERQHKISVLVKVWLFIAGLYMRADLYDDANGAIDEASRLVESFEADKGAVHANARRLFEKGWGSGKSVDELWADVWSAVSARISRADRATYLYSG